MTTKDLLPNEYLSTYSSYINYAANTEMIEGLIKGKMAVISFYNELSEHILEYRYEDHKWRPIDILNHIIDTERIFAYRALRFARQDTTPLSGFDENRYAIESAATKRPIKDMLQDYEFTRDSTIALFKSFNSEMLKRKGIASGGEVSVRALAFLIIGHEKHHVQIIKERYLQK